MEKKKWRGSNPKCDFADSEGNLCEPLSYFVDGQTKHRGHWALMCPYHYLHEGLWPLGTGAGQKYDGKTLEKLEG